MRKLILRPLLIVTVPQAAVLAFYFLLRVVIGGSDGLKIAYAGLAGLALIVGVVFGAGDFFDFVLPGYEQEQLRLRGERERLQRQIDEEIGIPRIRERR